MRKSFVNIKIKSEEFDALIKITAEMSRYLYPYIREILLSRENFEKDSLVWNDFNKRFMELINERFNINCIKVKRLLNPAENDEILIKSLLTLSLCISNNGARKLKTYLFNF